MNRVLLLVLAIFISVSCNKASKKQIEKKAINGITFVDNMEQTNNFYDNTESYNLAIPEIIVDGEIANPGKVDFSKLSKHHVIVKETLLDSAGGDKFVGAFRYDGYSLFDILDKKILKKSNSDEFNQIIDIYVEIENDKGQRTVFSWGEIFYPNNLHKIIIAGSVARIVPSKTKELWNLPETAKLVAANDLITERNISNPVSIKVRSYPESFAVVKGLSPMYSSQIKLFNGSSLIGEISQIPENMKIVTFNTIFYGRGKGIHTTTPFSGVFLKELIQKFYPVNKDNLLSGIMCIVGRDGYRCAVSYSELFNRNDQQEFLLIKSQPEEDGGLYRIFAACDFFSDRAIKSIAEIHLRF